MFTVDDPADNIGDLVAWLTENHRPDYLYRGQNRDYPVMVPSFYRRIVTDLSDPSPVAEVDSDRLHDLSIQGHARLDMLSWLAGMCGVGLGNIIAQQYGLTSECLDVTQSVGIASFFATRKYPSYAQVEDGIGVIYRFDSSADRRLRFPFSLSDLDDLFERGRCDAGFFDFFVHGRNLQRVFDRDRWVGLQEAAKRTVSTISFATSWRDLSEAIYSRGAGLARSRGPGRDKLAVALNEMEWERTRFASQHGGFIRPAIHWESLVPASFSVIRERSEVAQVYGSTIDRYARTDDLEMDISPEDSGPIAALPLIIPSCAVKVKMVGIENLRSRPDCQPFFFRHGPTRSAFFYRRSLWPEPSEDPLYGALWHEAIDALIRRHYPNHIPPVDDPDTGLLDRGYRVVGERATRDARNIEDLYRGQFEDVEELIGSVGPSPSLLAVRGWTLMQMGRRREASSALIAAVRSDAESISSLRAFADAMRHWQKPGWALKALDHAATISPEDVRIIESRADLLLDACDLGGAALLVERALSLTESPRDWRERGRLVFTRLAIAEALGDGESVAAMREIAAAERIHLSDVDDLVADLRAKTKPRDE